MSVPVSPVGGYPVHVRGRLDPHLSRWLWLVKWLLAIPHLIVLAFLWVGFVVLSAVALVSIVITGRYPRAIFDFNVGVLRWTWRVAYYSYGALGTDAYPPFTLHDDPDYPATLTIDYPEHLSRGLALVKWWLLAIPHYLIVGFFLGGTWAASNGDTGSYPWRSGLVGLLVLFAAVVLLFRGTYPQPLFDLVLGLNRWVLRVAAYAGLMTDTYPPFRLDMGPDEPALMAIGTLERGATQERIGAHEKAVDGDAHTAPPPPSHWTGARIVTAVAGSLLAVAGLGIGGAGVTGLLVDGLGRDSAGYLGSGSERLTTPTGMLVVRDVDLGAGPGWASAARQVGTVRLRVTPTDGGAVFVGIAPTKAVDSYLASAAYDEVRSFGNDLRYTRSSGVANAQSPTAQGFWVASSQGTGQQELRWAAKNGTWTVIAVQQGTPSGLSVRADVAATVPHLQSLSTVLLVTGALVLLAGAGLLAAAVSAATGRRPQPAAGPEAGVPR